MQELLDGTDHVAFWCLYGEEFIPHLGGWSDKLKNKILDYSASCEYIRNCDVVIYQKIRVEKSPYFCEENLLLLLKQNTVKIKLPYIYIDFANYDDSMKILECKEIEKNVDIRISDLIKSNPNIRTMLGVNHPTTFLFLEILKYICPRLGIPFFNETKVSHYIENINIMGLPVLPV